MTAIAMILAHLAYDETIKEIRDRNPDFSAPAFESVIENDDVVKYTETCAESVREYLADKYSY